MSSCPIPNLVGQVANQVPPDFFLSLSLFSFSQYFFPSSLCFLHHIHEPLSRPPPQAIYCYFLNKHSLWNCIFYHSHHILKPNLYLILKFHETIFSLISSLRNFSIIPQEFHFSRFDFPPSSLSMFSLHTFILVYNILNKGPFYILLALPRTTLDVLHPGTHLLAECSFQFPH